MISSLLHHYSWSMECHGFGSWTNSVHYAHPTPELCYPAIRHRLQLFFADHSQLSGVIPKGHSLKILCLMFVYVLLLCKFVSGLILWFGDNFWFDDLHAKSIRDRLNIVFRHDVILCGWLSSKYQLTIFLANLNNFIDVCFKMFYIHWWTALYRVKSSWGCRLGISIKYCYYCAWSLRYMFIKSTRLHYGWKH